MSSSPRSRGPSGAWSADPGAPGAPGPGCWPGLLCPPRRPEEGRQLRSRTCQPRSVRYRAAICSPRRPTSRGASLAGRWQKSVSRGAGRVVVMRITSVMRLHRRVLPAPPRASGPVENLLSTGWRRRVTPRVPAPRVCQPYVMRPLGSGVPDAPLPEPHRRRALPPPARRGGVRRPVRSRGRSAPPPPAGMRPAHPLLRTPPQRQTSPPWRGMRVPNPSAPVRATTTPAGGRGARGLVGGVSRLAGQPLRPGSRQEGRPISGLASSSTLTSLKVTTWTDLTNREAR